MRQSLEQVYYNGSPVRVLEYPVLDSTNLELTRMGVPLGTVVVAKKQTLGRGRLGRSFFSPLGGLYISFGIENDSTYTVTAKAAVAVAQAAKDALGASLTVKWLNDLLLEDKKVAGILAEGYSNRMIVGIGVNIATSFFPEELKGKATSILGSQAPQGAIEKFQSALIKSFFGMIDRDCLASYKKILGTLGKKVKVFQADRELFQGLAVGLTDNYHLLVRTPEGRTQELSSGEIKIIENPE